MSASFSSRTAFANRSSSHFLAYFFSLRPLECFFIRLDFFFMLEFAKIAVIVDERCQPGYDGTPVLQLVGRYEITSGLLTPLTAVILEELAKP